MKISGETVIDTGAASSIGCASALQLAKCGAAAITLTDLDAFAMAETARLAMAFGVVMAPQVLDVADIKVTESWFTGYGAVDILHNNAGMVSGALQSPDPDITRLP